MYKYVSPKHRSGSLSGRGIVKCDSLYGISATESASDNSLSRADGKSFFTGSALPGAVNMVRTGAGEVSKRPGYSFVNDQVITAAFTPTGKECGFFISNGTLYVTDGTFNENSAIYKTVNLESGFDTPQFACIGKYVFMMNGESIYIYDTETDGGFYAGGRCNTINAPDTTYLPTLFIGCKPNGAGAAYEAVNLLNPFVAEQFISDGQSKKYTLHLECAGDVKMYYKTLSGEWQQTEVEGYTGTDVTAANIPTLQVAEGEDNVRIVYRREGFLNQLEKLASCTCAAEFGIAGYKDRAFLSASDKAAGIVYYSEMDEPLYIPDINYIRVGNAQTKIYSLAGQNTSLAVICNDNVYMLSGELNEADYNSFERNARFVITGIFKTPEPIGKIPPVIFDNEIVYLTKDGVCAITASGVLDERCCQLRSGKLHAHLLDENLEDCMLITSEEFLVISNRRDRLYLLDGNQFSLDTHNTPFSMRVYEGYIWQDVPAKTLWTESGNLCFGSDNGVYCFNDGLRNNRHYRDERERGAHYPVKAYWETPYIFCGDFHLNKFFNRIGLLLGDAYGDDGYPLNTDVRILARFDNEPWRVIKDYDGSHCIFRYDTVDYSRFTYNNTPSDYAVYKRLLHKKGRGLKLRFESDSLSEPFTLKQYSIEYQIM